MTGWTPDELTVLADASSLRLIAGDGPGPQAELGMVLVHGQLYVRAYRGTESRWFQTAQETGRGPHQGRSHRTRRSPGSRPRPR
jgi:hypothetical protein